MQVKFEAKDDGPGHVEQVNDTTHHDDPTFVSDEDYLDKLRSLQRELLKVEPDDTRVECKHEDFDELEAVPPLEGDDDALGPALDVE